MSVMSQVDPIVRHMIACEDVVTDPSNPRRISLIGLISAIKSRTQSPYPLGFPELCIFLELAECRGPAQGRIEIQEADSQQAVYLGQDKTVNLPTDPLEVVALCFRIRACVFPVAGLYWMQFWYNNHNIAQHPLLLR